MSSTDPIFIPNFNILQEDNINVFSLGQTYDGSAHLLQIPDAHQKGYRGEGITIGIIDDGYTPVDNLPDPKEIHSFGYGMDTSTHTGHGNLHMGIMAMQGKPFTGVLPNADYVVCKYLGYKGGTLEYLGQAIHRCLDSGCDIISIASGQNGINYHKDVVDALIRAVELDVPVHVAVGNSNRDVSFPANRPEAIGIGAIDYEKAPTDFQNFGETLMFVSFGKNVVSTDHQGKHPRIEGTSFAGPLSAGCGGLLIQKHKAIYDRRPTITEYANMLKVYSVDLTEIEGWDALTGYGLVSIDFFNDDFKSFKDLGQLDLEIVLKDPIQSPLKESKGCFGFFFW